MRVTRELHNALDTSDVALGLLLADVNGTTSAMHAVFQRASYIGLPGGSAPGNAFAGQHYHRRDAGFTMCDASRRRLLADPCNCHIPEVYTLLNFRATSSSQCELREASERCVLKKNSFSCAKAATGRQPSAGHCDLPTAKADDHPRRWTRHRV